MTGDGYHRSMREPILRISVPTNRPGSLELEGEINDHAVNALRLRLATVDMARDEIVIHCDGVTALDPGGTTRLWLVLRAWHDVTDQDVRLVGMPECLTRRLRSHPLASMIVNDDNLFRDPFDAGVVSGR